MLGCFTKESPLRTNLPLVERFPQYQQKDDLNGINQVGQNMSEMVFLRRNLRLVERFLSINRQMILMASIKLDKKCRKLMVFFRRNLPLVERFPQY